MKTPKGLNIKDKSGYCFTDMTNINDFDPDLLIINEIAVFSYNEECNTPYVVFNNINCVFRKSGKYKYLIFCKTQENKRMSENYTKIFDEIKIQIVSITDDDVFVMGKDFVRIKTETDDVLSYNEQINIPVCVIAISSIFKENEVYYPEITLQIDTSIHTIHQIHKVLFSLSSFLYEFTFFIFQNILTKKYTQFIRYIKFVFSFFFSI